MNEARKLTDGQKRYVDKITCVAAFLVMAEKQNQMWNGRTAKEAYEAFCEIVSVDAEKLREALL